MDNPYKRKKDPERVKQLILDVAMQLLAEKGKVGFSLQSVADAVGVTKGGLLHHFPNKQILMQATVKEVIGQLDGAIDDYIAQDFEPYGRFTRAYIYFTLQQDAKSIGRLFAALSMAMLTDQAFNEQWILWLNGRLEQHASTDDSMDLKLLRLAADGLWLAIYTGVDEQANVQQLMQEMLLRTYPNKTVLSQC